MAPKKSKKKAQGGNARGFATTSVPSKTKNISSGDGEGAHSSAASLVEEVKQVEAPEAGPQPQNETILAIAESTHIVELGTKVFNRLMTDVEVDRRTRKASILLSLPEVLVERILSLGHDQQSTFVQDKIPDEESMRYLYTGELLLRKIGLGEGLVRATLTSCPVISKPEALLYHVCHLMSQEADLISVALHQYVK